MGGTLSDFAGGPQLSYRPAGAEDRRERSSEANGIRWLLKCLICSKPPGKWFSHKESTKQQAVVVNLVVVVNGSRDRQISRNFNLLTDHDSTTTLTTTASLIATTFNNQEFSPGFLSNYRVFQVYPVMVII